ncbi:TRAP transporter small permease [Salinivibrio kushneri]|uniref:TRAP transporter small permease protein n=1 Tax=Salinivibrio kushneri TaxID=1908198 RepID=A0AA47KPR4_9GAMM|nr:TRAP transporter small permease subunit [Salinivibrio kushneri]WBA10512.1 TRAP transporter small permease subunit [Salinivibrio kushneri]
MLKRAINILDKYFEPVIIVAFTLGLFTFIILEILLRPFDISISWSGEAARYLFVWVIYFGVSYAIRDGRHIRVLALSNLLPTKIKITSIILSNFIFLVYQAVVLFYSIKITEKSWRLGQVAPAMEVPVALLYSCLIVSSLLSIIRLTRTINHDVIKLCASSVKDPAT